MGPLEDAERTARSHSQLSLRLCGICTSETGSVHTRCAGSALTLSRSRAVALLPMTLSTFYELRLSVYDSACPGSITHGNTSHCMLGTVLRLAGVTGPMAAIDSGASGNDRN